jgi:hypothetical protein
METWTIIEPTTHRKLHEKQGSAQEAGDLAKNMTTGQGETQSPASKDTMSVGQEWTLLKRSKRGF